MSDIDIIRGNNYPPAQWQFLTSTDPDVIFPLDGSVFKLTIKWSNSLLIELTSDADAQLAVDLGTSILAWNYSEDDSRELPLGRLAQYEIERWIDATQQTLIRGFVVVSDGLNPD